MAGFISDSEMEQLESSQSSQPKGFISDEEMSSIEASPEDTEWKSRASDIPSLGELKSLGRSAVQGLTLDFADEISGGAEALGRATFGEDKFSDLLGNYKKYRDESRSNFKEAKESNPNLYLAGEIVGSILPSLATGGGLAVANIGKVGATQLAKQLAKAGAIQGGASALGQSEADLTDPTTENLIQAGQDVATGGAIGAGAGVLLPQAIKGVGSLTNGIKNVGTFTKGIAEDVIDVSPNFVKRGVKAFDIAEQGIPVVGDKAKQILNKDSLKLSKDILDNIEKKYRTASKMVGKAISRSETVPKNTSSQLRRIQSLIEDEKVIPEDKKKLMDILDLYKSPFTKTEVVETGTEKALNKLNRSSEIMKGEAEASGSQVNLQSPEVLEDLGLVRRIVTETTPEGQTIPKFLRENIGEDTVSTETFEKFQSMSLQDLMNLKSQLAEMGYGSSLGNFASSKAKNMAKMVDEVIQSRITDPTLKSAFVSGNKKMSDIQNASDLFGEVGPKGLNEKNINTFAEKLQSNSNKTSNMMNSLSKQLGDEGKALISQASQLADRRDISNALQGEGSVLGGFVNPSSMAVRGGAALGNITNKAEKITKPVADFTKNMIRMPDESIRGVANKLRTSGNPNASDFADKLDKIIQSPKRDRLLWSLSQQPAFRELVNKDDEQN